MSLPQRPVRDTCCTSQQLRPGRPGRNGKVIRSCPCCFVNKPARRTSPGTVWLPSFPCIARVSELSESKLVQAAKSLWLDISHWPSGPLSFAADISSGGRKASFRFVTLQESHIRPESSKLCYSVFSRRFYLVAHALFNFLCTRKQGAAYISNLCGEEAVAGMQ
jgi:hypothetical protein